jgi:hypothetical protein
MTALTVQVAVNDEDGYILFGDDQTGFMGNTETFSHNAKVIIGRDNSDASTLITYFGWAHLKNLTIAQGATINSAKLYLYWHASAGFDSSGDPSEGMVVKAQDTDSGAKPANYSTVNGWTLTTASATASSFIDASQGMMGPNEEFSAGWYPSAGLEIKTILQELVDRGGWSSGSNVNLKLTPSAHDGAIDWTISWKDRDTSSSLAPKLVIDYTAAAASTPTSPAFLMFLD